ncbi:MAG: hypothetical protein P8107_11380, partial [Spirochaetia bacterium]
MKQRIVKLIGTVLIVAGIMSLSTCSFVGDVYIAFFWSTANDAPAVGTVSTIPNFPGYNNLVNGSYFVTLPGSYVITYFGAVNNYTKTITLEAAATIGGVET